ncbi:MAG: hypothetical protein ACR2O3_17870 [Rhizobiaceae bacterium]
MHRIELQTDKLIIGVNTTKLHSVLIDADQPPNGQSEIKTIELNHQIRKRGVEAKLVFANPEARVPNPDHHLI